MLGYDAERLQRLRRHRYRRRVVRPGRGGRRRRLPGARAARAGEGHLLSQATDPLSDLGAELGIYTLVVCKFGICTGWSIVEDKLLLTMKY